MGEGPFGNVILYDRNVREAAVPMDVNRLDLLDEFKSCNVRELEGCNPVAPPPPPWATLGAKTLADDMEATLWAELRTLYPPPPPLLYRDPLEFLAE